MLQPATSTIVLFLAFLLLATGCVEGPKPPEEVPGAVPTTIVDSTQQIKELLASFEREVWQKPKLIINRMGSLSEKTIADVGAGFGYFTFRLAPQAQKVIAIEIDPQAIETIKELKRGLNDTTISNRIETRLVAPNDPGLKPGEVDLVIMVNTYMYIDNRVAYLKKLQHGLKPGGELLIIDYKKRNLPIGPSSEIKLSLSQVEQEVKEAGWRTINTDDTSLEYQYIVIASP